MLYQQKLGFKDLDQKYFIRRATFCLTALIDGLDKNSNFKHSKSKNLKRILYQTEIIKNCCIFFIVDIITLV